MEARQEARTHFDDLTDAISVKVLQYFSENPRRTNWRQELSPDALIELSCPHHPLHHTAQAEVKVLRLSSPTGATSLFHTSLRRFFWKPTVVHATICTYGLTTTLRSHGHRCYRNVLKLRSSL